MKQKKIYETLNEEGILKSTGPFRKIITDNIGSLGQKTGDKEIYKPLVQGDTIIYENTTIIIKNEILSNKDEQI